MKTIAVLCMLLVVSWASLGCGEGRTINGTYHDTVGVLTQEHRDPDVCYTVIFGNVVWSIILVSTIVAPVYFIGWSIMEPVADTNCPYSKE